MSLLHCQSSYYTDFHTVVGLITTRYSTLSKLSMRLIDQIQPTLYFSVNNEEVPRFSKGSRVTHVTVCCIPSRKNNCLPVMAQRENRIFVNKCYIYKSLFFSILSTTTRNKMQPLLGSILGLKKEEEVPVSVAYSLVGQR